jgi:hypothetical protein
MDIVLRSSCVRVHNFKEEISPPSGSSARAPLT